MIFFLPKGNTPLHLAVAKRTPCYECVYLLLKHHATSLVFNNNLQSPLSIIQSLGLAQQTNQEADSKPSGALVTSAIDQQRSLAPNKPLDTNKKKSNTSSNTNATNSVILNSNISGINTTNNNSNTISAISNNNSNSNAIAVNITPNWDYSISTIHSRLISDLFKNLELLVQNYPNTSSSMTPTNTFSSKPGDTKQPIITNQKIVSDSFQKNRNLSKSNDENNDYETPEISKIASNNTNQPISSNSNSNFTSKSDKQKHFFKKSNTQVQKSNRHNQPKVDTKSTPSHNGFKSSLKKKRLSLSNPVSLAAAIAATSHTPPIKLPTIVNDPHSTTYEDESDKKKRILSHSSSEANTTQIVSLSSSIKRKNIQIKSSAIAASKTSKQPSLKSINKKTLAPVINKIEDISSSCLSLDKLNEQETSTSFINITGATPSPMPSPAPSPMPSQSGATTPVPPGKKNKFFTTSPFSYINSNVNNVKKLNLINEEKLMIEKNARYAKATPKANSAVVVRMSTLSNFAKKIDKQNSISAIMINKGNNNNNANNDLNRKLNEAYIYNDSLKQLSIDEDCSRLNMPTRISDNVSPVSSKISLFKKTVSCKTFYYF